MDGAAYWRKHGGEWPLILRSLAQAVFGAPASAGCVERDFNIVDTRTDLSPADREMALYLRGQSDSIPRDIPKLSDEAAAKAIPDRLTDLEQLDEVQMLDYTPVFDFLHFAEDEDDEEYLREFEEDSSGDEEDSPGSKEDSSGRKRGLAGD